MRTRPWGALLVLLMVGCAHARPQVPGIRPHLDVFPAVTIAGQGVTLTALLEDPAGLVRCPALEWLWPDGTRSEHIPDCDPRDVEVRHVEHRRVVMGSQSLTFEVRWHWQGHTWPASVTVDSR